MHSLKRISGIRTSATNPLMANYEKAGKKTQASKYNNFLLAALNEVGMLDDMWRSLTAEQIWDNWLYRGEVFGCFKDENPVGYLVLSDIVLGRHATKSGYLIPAERNHFAFEQQLLDYAFKNYPDGLGLVKVKSNIPSLMVEALQGFTVMGECVGGSPYDGLYTGQPSDMLHFEVYSPLIQSAEVLNGSESIGGSATSERASAPTSGLHSTGGLPESGSIRESGGLPESGGGDFGSNVEQLQSADGEPDDDGSDGSGGFIADGLTDLERQLSSFA